jgi:FkbM family methyltransferase
MLKVHVKSMIHSLGWELKKVDKDIQSKKEKSVLWLKSLDLKTVLDIGANDGGFAHHIRAILPDVKIYSFEPLKDCFEKLRDSFVEDSKFFPVNLALGDKSEISTIYRSSFSPSSSLLPMADLHKQAFPYTSEQYEERIQVVRLDEAVSQLDIDYPLLVKIDVQGFEAQVIAGGINTLSRARMIIIEMSIEKLYEGQELFDSVYRRLHELGFHYYGNYDQLCHPEDGRVLQIDAIFMKN